MDNQNPKPEKKPLILAVDAGSLLVIILAALLIPLLLTGFFAH